MSTSSATVPAGPALTEQCPWCESEISRRKFESIQRRIRREERLKLDRVQRRVTKELEEKSRDAIAKMEEDATRRVEAAREEARKETMKQLAVDIESSKEALEVAKEAKEAAEKKAKDIEAAQAKAKEDEARRFAEEVSRVRDEAAKEAGEELLSQREVLEKAKDRELAKKDAELRRERENHAKKLKQMQRQLEAKTSNALGDGAELDLLETLRDAFPDDRITPIKKGHPGADIRHEILRNGDVHGVIVYDSKNRRAWQNRFVAKLREDQINDKADHAILSTNTFPRGEKELCIREDVIVASPARVVAIVEMLRSFSIQAHVLRLSADQRGVKSGKLYEFITSEAFAQRIRRAEELSDKILDLDVDEKKAHEKTWRARGELAVTLRRQVREIDTQVMEILEG